MSKYRILEKRGEFKKVTFPGSPNGCNGHYCCSCGETEEIYVPKFIVQELLFGNDDYRDLCIVTSLKKAKKKVRDLLLDNKGIIHE